MPASQPSNNRPSSSAPVLVIGHKNPDTDAVCSAIGQAEFLRRSGVASAVAACCGGLNPRTTWALEQAGIEPPRLVMDVRPTAASICRREIISARADETFLEVYHRMKQEDVRSLPVLDAEGKVLGVPTIGDLMELLMHAADSRESSPDQARQLTTSLANVASTLGAEVLTGFDLERQQEFTLTVSASSEPVVAERLNRYPSGQIMVIVGDRPRVHDLAIERGVRAMVITGAASPPSEMVERARAAGVSLLRYPFDTASAVQLLRCSRSIAAAVPPRFLSIPSNTLASSLPTLVQDTHQALFPVICDEDGSLLGVFSKSDLIDPPRQKLVLVDHNEFSQAVTGADEAEILEVIDHHRLSGNLVSREPVRFINDPVGSTSTIVARAFRQSGWTPDRSTAICLCAGMISDTLNLTSPTTTDTDREILPWLAGIAGVDPEVFAREFFAAGSMLRSAPAGRIIGLDRKEFHEHGWRISISQIEENRLDDFPGRQKELEESLGALCEDRDLDCAALLITDIRRLYSLLLISGEEAIVREIDCPRDKCGTFRLDGVVSRKKQFFPYMSRVLAKARRRSA
ncbi:MAG: putative manganese-dependent inorganic diphosphatase [Verrucomicrobiales bacterium]